MTEPELNLRTCSNGHRYFKSSDCPVCPVCEKQKTPAGGLPAVAAPARRALERAGITSLEALSGFSETEILKLHGMGPHAIKKLHAALEHAGLSFLKK